jgi:hypothetical protein
MKAESAGPYLAVVLLAAFLFSATGYFLNKAFWARHLAPVFPVMVFSVALMARDAWRTSPRWTGAAAVGLAALWLFSSLNLRFNPIHRNEDYRGAALLARDELNRGGVVWWQGSWHCAVYYKLPVDLEGRFYDARFFNANGLDAAGARLAPRADLIVTTKPDIYDGCGTVRAMAKDGNYQAAEKLNGFVLLRPR